MKKISVVLISLFILIVSGGAFTAFAGQYDNYVSVADLQKVTGLKGITCNTNGSVFNFFTSDRREIVEVYFLDMPNAPSYVKKCTVPLTGIGDQAWQGTTNSNPGLNLLVFMKKGQYVALTVYANANSPGKNMMTNNQTLTLAGVIANRIR